MQNEAKPTLKPIIVKKRVKHVFTFDETHELHMGLLKSLENYRALESEFDSVKATYKAKLTEAESQRDTLMALIRAGWEMRDKDCEVKMRPADSKKDYYVWLRNAVTGDEQQVAVLTEDMTKEDFAQDLFRAESIFSNKAELVLWEAGADRGIIVVGAFGDRWFSAVRGNIGAQQLEERLDSEQRSYKVRYEAIERAAKRCQEWLVEVAGKDVAKGFTDAIAKAVEAEKEKVE